MTEPLVSVVIPTIGRAELHRAIASVMSQTMKKVELVVVLDRPELEEKLRKTLPVECVLVCTPGAVGGAAARNVGVSSSHGRLIAYLDDDDWWEPTKLERQLASMRMSGERFSWTWTFFESDRGVEVLPRTEIQDDDTVASYLVRRSRIRHGDGYIQSSSLLLERQLAIDVSWNEALSKHQDWDLVVRVAETCGSTGACCPEPLVHVAQGSMGSISKERSSEASRLWLTLHQTSLHRREAGDFIATQLLRSSLYQLRWSESFRYARMLILKPPHLAALVVAGFGLIERFKGMQR